MASVESKSESLAARSMGLLRGVGESFVAFFVLCVFTPSGFVSDLQY